MSDYELIEASFAQQYGIRLRREDAMTWEEFVNLLAGLNGDTPLGQVVRIRSEKDPKALKSFTPQMRQIRARWRVHQGKQAQNQYTKAEYDNAMAGIAAAIRTMCSKEAD